MTLIKTSTFRCLPDPVWKYSMASIVSLWSNIKVNTSVSGLRVEACFAWRMRRVSFFHGPSIILGRLQLVPHSSQQHKTDDTSVHGKSTARCDKLSFHFNRAKMLKYKFYQRYLVFSKTEEPFELARHFLFWPSYSNLCYTKYLSFVSLDVFKLWLTKSTFLHLQLGTI